MTLEPCERPRMAEPGQGEWARRCGECKACRAAKSARSDAEFVRRNVARALRALDADDRAACAIYLHAAGAVIGGERLATIILTVEQAERLAWLAWMAHSPFRGGDVAIAVAVDRAAREAKGAA